ncbi:hypothetical protein [Streptomyces sp. DH24]|uniref:hypothetical protein n=1 Tax=Streptomyces sp. DH24 TaxID=3040123 RepID=UPI0024424F5B|nr:hypothetical protein [Streptomyces sp. DH24]MDG9717398.1 hypothetical protein [Streptomyces sp. DH24]
MIVVYTPADGEPEHYDASSLKVSEAAIVQRTVDMKWQEILRGLEEDDLDAMRGIVWVIKKRSQPSLRFGDFDPGVTELTSRMDNKEIQRWLDATLDAVAPEMEWETVEGIISGRIDDVAVDPEYARKLLASRAPGPKETPAEDSVRPVTEPDSSASPSPTSSEPETPTSDSSPTSSTSPRPPSMTSPSATSTT